MTPLLAAITIAASFLLVNLLAFVLFGMDKAAAKAGSRRISERTLLTVSLAGGSPAALYACSHFRHKTRKQPFRTLLLAIVALQIAALVAVAAYLI